MANILLFDNGLPFDLNTPYHQSLGGSETSILLYAKGLSVLGHSVVLLSNSMSTPQREKNLILDNSNNFYGYAGNADVIILNRVYLETSKLNKPVFYFAHDAYDQQHVMWMPLGEKYLNSIKKIICLSKWQKESFNKNLNVPLEKMEILGNPLDLSVYQGTVDRNDKRLIFASIPYKGIEPLADVFNDVCIKIKKDDLELHVFSSMNLYGNPEGDKQYEAAFSKLYRNGAILNNVTSMQELARQFMMSSLIILPSTYHETFCMNSIQAQAAGCLPVSVNNGAISETIIPGETGFITEGKNIYNNKCYNEFVDLICNLLEKDLYTNRLSARKYVQKYDHILMASKLLKILGL